MRTFVSLQYKCAHYFR